MMDEAGKFTILPEIPHNAEPSAVNHARVHGDDILIRFHRSIEYV